MEKLIIKIYLFNNLSIDVPYESISTIKHIIEYLLKKFGIIKN